MIDGEQAYKIGLVNHVVPQNEAGDAAYLKALEVAEQIIPNVSIFIILQIRINQSQCNITVNTIFISSQWNSPMLIT